MSETLKNIEIIEAYSEGKLSIQEKIDFENRLLSDLELKADFELYKSIVEGIKAAGEDQLRAKLRTADFALDAQTNVSEKSTKSLQMAKYWTVAASVTIVLCAFVFIKFIQTPRLEKLAEKYYEKEKGLPVQMSMESSSMDSIMNLYKNSDYKLAKKGLQAMLVKDLSNDTLNYFLGVTLYELGDYKGADECFVQIKQNSAYFQKCQYRELLVFLKTKNMVMVGSSINEILKNRDHLYYDKAEQLRSELSD